MPLQTSVPSRHWLQDWMDEFEITQPEQARARLRYPGAAERLYEVAFNHYDANDDQEHHNGGSVVAGPGLDHKMGMCISANCRNEVADREIGKVLHYFDSLLIEGPPSLYYVGMFEDRKQRNWHQRLNDTLTQDVAVLCHLEGIGATRYLNFVKKPLSYSEEEQSAFAEEIGRPELASDSAIEDLARTISRSGGIEVVEVAPRQWLGRIRDPLFQGMGAHTFMRKTRPKKYEVAEQLIQTSFTVLLTDAIYARKVGAPIASAVQPRFFSESADPGQVSVDNVALSLKIPLFEQLTTRQVIALREESPSEFERFRMILRNSIRQAVEQSPDADRHTLADKVWREQVVPEIADINRKTEGARRTLFGKAAFGVPLGATIAAIGVAASLPWVATAGLGVAITPLAELYKYLESRHTTRLSDFYFLWKASRDHAH